MKTISKPSLKSARKLSAPEMNNIHFSAERTVLTPALLARLASNRQTSQIGKTATATSADSVPSKAASTDINTSSATNNGKKAADTDITFG